MTTQIRLKDETYEKIRYIADKEGRSINKQMGYAIELYIKDYEKLHNEIKIDKA